jgi:isopenicillin N synthase-like dioxygenase
MLEPHGEGKAGVVPAKRLTGVPNVNIAPFLAGSPEGRAKVVAEVKRACEEVGFFMISGHGVPLSLIEGIRDVTYRFFNQPMEEKLKSKTDPAIVGSNGFEVMGTTALARSLGKSTPPDYREAFKVGVSVPAHDPYYQKPEAKKYFQPNVWPSKPEDFRATYEAYYKALDGLAATVMRIFALALDLGEDFFADKMDHAVAKLNAIFYLPQTEPPAEGQLRAGEHTDYGTLTVLLAEDKPGGLQVKMRSGEWVDVRPPNDAFVVNIGDMMMHWTNDHWLSNLHRVTNPPRESAHIPRLSIVMFQKPNYDAVIKCIERYAGKASAPKYGPVTAGEHWYAKNEKARPVAKAS